MSSGHSIGKKEVEQVELDYFLDAYKFATGQRLVLIQSSERPDFICVREDRTHVGVELTRGDGNVGIMEHIRREHGELDFSLSALDRVFSTIVEKERKRQTQWTLPESAILVVQLFFHSIEGISDFLTEDLQSDFQEFGFSEIWLADYTAMETYDVVELFGLKPVKWWGYHERPNPSSKPFG